MTKSEAINLLKQVNHILVNSNSWLENTHEPLNIAFDMAIKALEQQDKIAQIFDDYDYLEAWEILEMIKEAMRND